MSIPPNLLLKISIVCSNFQEVAQILTQLKALERQSYPTFEVILLLKAEIHHNINTLNLLSAFKGRYKLIVIQNTQPEPYRRVLQTATGEIITWLDGSVIPAYHWLKSLAYLFQNPARQVISCPATPLTHQPLLIQPVNKVEKDLNRIIAFRRDAFVALVTTEGCLPDTLFPGGSLESLKHKAAKAGLNYFQATTPIAYYTSSVKSKANLPFDWLAKLNPNLITKFARYFAGVSKSKTIPASQPFLQFQPVIAASQAAQNPLTGQQSNIKLSNLPLRLCLLSQSYEPENFDGIGRLTNLMAKGLFELGHEVHIIYAGATNRLDFYEGAYIHSLPFDFINPPGFHHFKSIGNIYWGLSYTQQVHTKVKELIFSHGIQLVDSPNWQYQGLFTACSGILPVAVRLVTGALKIGQMEGLSDSQQSIELQALAEGLLIEKAAYLLPNTPGTLTSLVKDYHFQPNPAKYSLVPYGIVPVEEAKVKYFDTERATLSLTILFVGRLEKRKGILDLLAALPVVIKQVPQVRVIITGKDNSLNDGFYELTGMNYLQHFARTYPACQNQVSFTGQVTEAQLQELYQNCDLFVAPSLYESFGLIYLEAMNYGKPVIGCNTGGIPNVVADGINGLLVEPNSPDALAQAIIKLLQSPQLLRAFGEASRAILLQKFNYLAMAKNYEQAYRKMLADWVPNY